MPLNKEKYTSNAYGLFQVTHFSLLVKHKIRFLQNKSYRTRKSV